MKILRLFSILKKHKYFVFHNNPIACYDILNWNLSLKLVENPPRVWKPPSQQSIWGIGIHMYNPHFNKKPLQTTLRKEERHRCRRRRLNSFLSLLR